MMIKSFIQERELVLYMDLHGHSRKKNVFMYGCENPIGGPIKRFQEMIFPRLLELSCPIFSFADSTFHIQKSKESTARVVVRREFGIINSYTLEASFCGSTKPSLDNLHFTVRDYQHVGYALCDSILDFCDPDQTMVHSIQEEFDKGLLVESSARRASATFVNTMKNEDPFTHTTADSIDDGFPNYLSRSLSKDGLVCDLSQSLFNTLSEINTINSNNSTGNTNTNEKTAKKKKASSSTHGKQKIKVKSVQTEAPPQPSPTNSPTLSSTSTTIPPSPSPKTKKASKSSNNGPLFLSSTLTTLTPSSANADTLLLSPTHATTTHNNSHSFNNSNSHSHNNNSHPHHSSGNGSLKISASAPSLSLLSITQPSPHAPSPSTPLTPTSPTQTQHVPITPKYLSFDPPPLIIPQALLLSQQKLSKKTPPGQKSPTSPLHSSRINKKHSSLPYLQLDHTPLESYSSRSQPTLPSHLPKLSTGKNCTINANNNNDTSEKLSDNNTPTPTKARSLRRKPSI
eukprot:TRINITY_DN15001_c0_g1_i1.p1 TRINITY_DN15001_c0_g1~~TRINITY_DN15001_c0_g1_i1.p1  ORF type:complete len:574 (+),score=117.05 TRINITY_DN15001_c0_g1_i1:185-1723(+)